MGDSAVKRDWDLVRKLLFYLEEKSDDRVIRNVQIEGYETLVINYHLVLLAEAGLITFEASRSTSNPERIIQVYPTQLTWEGHEFLEITRDDNKWNSIKQKVLGITGGLGIDMIRTVATEAAKRALDL
jgi:hypothetical protein